MWEEYIPITHPNALGYLYSYSSLCDMCPQTVKSFLNYPAPCSRVWLHFFMGDLGIFLLAHREVRDSPAHEEPVTDREKPGDGWTVPGTAAKPHVPTGTSITASGQGGPELLLRGSLARGAERKLTLVLLLRCCLRRKSAHTDFCNDC